MVWRTVVTPGHFGTSENSNFPDLWPSVVTWRKRVCVAHISKAPKCCHLYRQGRDLVNKTPVFQLCWHQTWCVLWLFPSSCPPCPSPSRWSLQSSGNRTKRDREDGGRRTNWMLTLTLDFSWGRLYFLKSRKGKGWRFGSGNSSVFLFIPHS